MEVFARDAKGSLTSDSFTVAGAPGETRRIQRQMGVQRDEITPKFMGFYRFYQAFMPCDVQENKYKLDETCIITYNIYIYIYTYEHYGLRRGFAK